MAKLTRRLAVLFITVAPLVLATACPNNNDGAGDAPIARAENDGWVVLNNVDRYPNIAFRCFGVNGIYAPRTPDSGNGRPVVVVPDDPMCKQQPK